MKAFVLGLCGEEEDISHIVDSLKKKVFSST
jgi:hypothetical protein